MVPFPLTELSLDLFLEFTHEGSYSDSSDRTERKVSRVPAGQLVCNNALLEYTLVSFLKQTVKVSAPGRTVKWRGGVGVRERRPQVSSDNYHRVERKLLSAPVLLQ